MFQTKTVLDPGYQVANVQTCKALTMIDVDYLLGRVAELRAEWSEAAGDDLSAVTLDLGALLADFETMVQGR